MSIFKKSLIFIISLCIRNCIPINARIKEIISLTNRTKDHTLFFASEDHTRSRATSLAQSKQLIHFLRATDASLIAEDPSSITNRTFSLTTLYQKRKTINTSVDHLTSLARHTGITATNIEFRSDTNRHRSKVSVDQFIEETNNIVQEIEQYDDGPTATHYYQEVISRHRNIVEPNCKQMLDQIKKKNRGLALDVELPPTARDTAALYGPIAPFDTMEPRKQVRRALIDYNAELIDARLLHAILVHQKQGKKKTLVCAGGWHLRNLYRPLACLGYYLNEHYPIIIDSSLPLNETLKKFCPDYDPNAKLPKTAADRLLDYTEWEQKHPHLVIAIPASILLTFFGTIAYLLTTIISGANET